MVNRGSLVRVKARSERVAEVEYVPNCPEPINRLLNHTKFRLGLCACTEKINAARFQSRRTRRRAGPL